VIEWANKPAAPLPGVMEIREHSESVYAVAVSHDGKWIASGSGDKTVKVVMVETGRVVHTLEGHR
jgi:WD40 repeat protein